MKKYITYILIFGIIGLIFGYFLFGKVAGEYISIKTILSSSTNAFESFGRNISGLTHMKQNILISGGIGGFIGYIIVLIRKK